MRARTGTAPHIIVVGGGPTGAAAALGAAERGFRVTLVEAEREVDAAPRAATFHPSTLEMIDDLGIMDEFVAAGLVARYFDFWDKPTLRLIARLDHQVLKDDTRFPYVVQVEQHKVVRIILRRLEERAGVSVHLGAKAIAISQGKDDVTVGVDGPNGPYELTGDWLIGADGGRSTVRRLIDVEFEGYTWPERFLVLTTTFDFEAAIGCSYRSYFADPEEWANVFKVAGDDGKGRWRVVTATHDEESDEAALSDPSCVRRLHGLSPDAGIGHVEHRNLYKVHQRVASRFRVGRVLLAGDAAHVNNPIGGLGLNCGIHDVIGLLDTLGAVRDDGDETALDRYALHRREMNVRYVQEQTVANKQRLEEKDPVRRAERRAELERIAADPVRQRAFLLRTSLLASLRDSRAGDPTPNQQGAEKNCLFERSNPR